MIALVFALHARLIIPGVVLIVVLILSLILALILVLVVVLVSIIVLHDNSSFFVILGLQKKYAPDQSRLYAASG